MQTITLLACIFFVYSALSHLVVANNILLLPQLQEIRKR